MTKVAKCRYTEWKGFSVEERALDSLFEIAHPNNEYLQDQLRISLANTGLINPLVIVQTSSEKAIEYWYPVRRNANKPPEGLKKLEILYVGHNRATVLRELGFTHVDVVVVHDFDTAVRLDKESMSGFQHMQKPHSWGN